MTLQWECFIDPRLRWRYARQRLVVLGEQTQKNIAWSLRGVVSCAFVGDRAMKKHHLMYRGKNKTTDVLSFLYHTQRQRGIQSIDGELIFSVPEIRRQARRMRLSPLRVADRLVVHGLLHLLGYDHERNARAAVVMFKLEERILMGEK